MKYTAGTATVRTQIQEGGDYNLRITGAKEKTSAAGNGMIELRMEIAGPVGGALNEQGEGESVYDNLVFVDNALWKIDQFRAALGDDIVEGEEVDVQPDELIGAILPATVSIGTNQSGKRRLEVEAFLVPNPF